MSAIETLQNMELFGDMDEDTLQRLANHLELRRFKPDEVICYEGDPADVFYIVHSGSVKVMKLLAGQNTTVATLGVSQHFGEMGILMEAPRTATIAANEECELLALSVEAAETVLVEEPYAAAMFMRALAVTLAQRLADTTAKLSELQQQGA